MAYYLPQRKLLLFVIFLLLLLVAPHLVQAAESYQFVKAFPATPLNYPEGVAVDGTGNVYVADSYNDRIQKFDSSGTFITAWGGTGSGDGQFNTPESVAVDSSGNVYVVDFANHRVQKFSSSGAFITKWGGVGSGDGQFTYPRGIAVDSGGNVYVTDTNNNRIQKFDSSGGFIAKWGSPGSGDGQFYFPWGIAVDGSGNVYVTDIYNNRIQKFDSSGAFIAKWDSFGSGDGQFTQPRGIAVDSGGNVYVTDYNSRVQKFDSSGTFITAWGSSGSGNGQLSWQADGIAIDGTGNVYVADTGNNRIVEFKLTVNNVAPTVGLITAPVDPTQVNTAINVSANFTDPGTLDTHTAVWDWGDGTTSDGTVTETNGAGQVAGSHAYAVAGVYTIKVTVTDEDGGVGYSIFQYVVTYDPNAGFVTGGGWINSPAGAYVANPGLTGKATFGFVSKYQKGATIPTGNTEFQFQTAGLNFHSTSYDWLVISGAKAQYKGTGTINGTGNYNFILTAIDGRVMGGGGVDKFRIKIWDKTTGSIVYDNQMGADDTSGPTTAIAGGSIMIHN